MIIIVFNLQMLASMPMSLHSLEYEMFCLLLLLFYLQMLRSMPMSLHSVEGAKFFLLLLLQKLYTDIQM